MSGSTDTVRKRSNIEAGVHVQQVVDIDFVATPLDVTPYELGIVTAPPDGTATMHLRSGQMMIEIGEIIVVDGTVHAIPRRGTGACHRRYLLGAAEAAVFGTCHRELGWHPDVTRSGRDCWVRFISIPADVEMSTRTVGGRVALGLPTHWTP